MYKINFIHINMHEYTILNIYLLLKALSNNGNILNIVPIHSLIYNELS